MADITTINSLEFSMYHPPIGRHLVTQYQRLTKKKKKKEKSLVNNWRILIAYLADGQCIMTQPYYLGSLI